MKRMAFAVTFAAAFAWVLAPISAAQGRGAGASHGGGAGAGGSMADSSAHGNSANGNMGNANGAAGPKTPGALLTQNAQLSKNLGNLLPPGTDLQTASAGFKNLGQFVAAVHVSHNLDIPFASLKCTELAQAQFCPTGMTVPTKSSSLGQSIQTLKPAMNSTDSKSAAKQAEKEADTDINSSGGQS